MQSWNQLATVEAPAPDHQAAARRHEPAVDQLETDRAERLMQVALVRRGERAAQLPPVGVDRAVGELRHDQPEDQSRAVRSTVRTSVASASSPASTFSMPSSAMVR